MAEQEIKTDKEIESMLNNMCNVAYATKLGTLIMKGGKGNGDVEKLQYYGTIDIEPSDSSYFTVNATGETITGLTDDGKTQTELVIPYKINGVTITRIYGDITTDTPAISTAQKVVLPNSVTEIGNLAFYTCASLTSLNIPDSVKSIGIGAFSNCTSLTSINIPNSVSSIGTHIFEDCTSLTAVNMPTGVTHIKSGAFSNCSALVSINVSNNVTNIDSGAFNGCTNLTIYCEQGSVAENFAKENNIPIVYTDIKESAISTVYKIKGSSIIANLPTNPNIGDVYNITDSGKITGTEIVVSAGDNIVYTSEGWDKLAASVDLSNYQEKLIFDTTPIIDSSNPVTSGGIKTALDGKADKATTLNDYGIIDAYTKIEIDNKENVLKLADERLKYYGDKDIVPSDENYFIVNATGETITGLTAEGKTQTELVIPYKINGIEITTLFSGEDNTSILDGANNKITKVVLPNSITNIDGFAFFNCSVLTSINIPDNVTIIGDFAFYSCSSLKSINIPAGVTSIRDYTFDGCRKLVSINMPNSVTSIGDNVFYGCTSLKSISIPNSVTSIGRSAFFECTSLKSISISNSVTSIQEDTFFDCTNLIIYCEQGSYAESFAKANNIPVVYTDVTNIVTNSELDAVNSVPITTKEEAILTASSRSYIYSTEYSAKNTLYVYIEPSDINVAALIQATTGYEIDLRGTSVDNKIELISTSIGAPVLEGISEGDLLKFEFYNNSSSDVTVYIEETKLVDIKTAFNITNTALDEKVETTEVLTKTNTIEFTPTADYQPATKKYVDDNVSSAGGGDMLKAVYDTDNTGVVDNAEKLGGLSPESYGRVSAPILLTISNVESSWTSQTDTEGTTYYTQIFENENFIGEADYMADIKLSDDIATARKQLEAYDSVNKVSIETGQAIVYCFESIPSIELNLQIKRVY